MIVAGDRAAIAKVVDADIAVLAGARRRQARRWIQVYFESGFAVLLPHRTRWLKKRARTNPELDIRLIEMLAQKVAETVELIAELNVVRALPSTLEPSQIRVNLDGLVRVSGCKARAIGGVHKSLRLLQRRRQRFTSIVNCAVLGIKASAVRLPIIDDAIRW